MVVEQRFEVRNVMGLHARAATLLVLTASRFSAEIEFERNGRRANGKSVIGILLIVAAGGDTVTIRCNGPDARNASEALGALVGSGFGETDSTSARGDRVRQGPSPVHTAAA